MINTIISCVSELINGKIILITGGTGTFGHELVKCLLNNFSPKKIIIFSRDEFKQYMMKQLYPENKYPIEFFIGDVRDYDRILKATKNVDVVFHAAAMKQVDTIEKYPIEAIKTNILGTENVIKSCLQNNVKKVIGISTDKSVSPINLYGATKLCGEKLMIDANTEDSITKFSVLRYGNVFNSRGSVVPIFLNQQKTGTFTITDTEMTRFTLTITQAINFVLNCASIMKGGEIFVPKLFSYNILQLARCIDPNCKIVITGRRPGEKLHEQMISCNESHRAIDNKTYYTIISDYIYNNMDKNDIIFFGYNKEYTSNINTLIEDNKLIDLINNCK